MELLSADSGHSWSNLLYDCSITADRFEYLLTIRNLGRQQLLFFAVYEIYKIIHSVQWGQFFYLTKIAKSFYSKINDSSRVRTTAFSSSRFGVRVSVVPNNFTIYP